MSGATAVLYARVSTEEQATTGYSLGQQLEALRRWTEAEGFEVLEEVQDRGWSGASLTRPGLDRVRDLVEAGGVGVVVAQDRDRFARKPAYLSLLKEDFAEHGTALRALSDRGDDSPEGVLSDGILDQIREYERTKIRERTRRGLLRKAQSGEVIKGPKAPYGFRFEDERDVLEVCEPEMAVVRYIFRLLAVEGASQYSLRDRLESEGIAAPSGRRWNTTTLRNLVRSDLYKPHAYEEVEALVTPEVAAKLDENERYGLWTWNRRKTTKKAVSEPGPGGTVHRHRYTAERRPDDECIYVPTVDPTIPREHVEAAREAINSRRSPSKAASRFWVLSGGLIRCWECESVMSPQTVTSGGRKHYYYACRQRFNNPENPCSNGKHVRADHAEDFVWRAVSRALTKPEMLRERFDNLIERERAAMRGDPERDARRWLDRLSEIDRERQSYIRLAGKSRISDAELDTELDRLDGERKTAQQEIDAARNRSSRIEELEDSRDRFFEQWTVDEQERLDNFTPEDKRALYQQLRLTLRSNRDGILMVSCFLGHLGDAEDVRKSENTSWRT